MVLRMSSFLSFYIFNLEFGSSVEPILCMPASIKEGTVNQASTLNNIRHLIQHIGFGLKSTILDC